MRKVLIFVLLVAAAVAGTSSFARAQGNLEDQIEVLRGSAETDRKALITSNVDFTEQESLEFWPVYNQYRGDMDAVNDRMIALIRKYADHYQNLTDAVAAELMSDAMDIEDDRMIYKRLYVEELLEILPTRKVVVLFQIENKLEAAVKYGLSEVIPVVSLTEESTIDTNQ